MFTDSGIELLLNVALGATAKAAAFYVGLIDADTFVGTSSSDTMSSHTGWTEYTDYSEVTRPQITFGAASAGTITNPVSADFTPNADADVCGFFITTNSTKSGTTGTLVAVGILDQGTREVQAGVTEQFTGNVTLQNISSEVTGEL